jgi:sterol desaturase/sphingolipid hydroxylase (fatty acid hydroxylase superfamily)
VAVPREVPSTAQAEKGRRDASGQRRALSSRVDLGALCIAAVGVALVGMGWRKGFAGAGFATSTSTLRGILFGPISLAILGLFLVVERVRPAQRRPLIARGHRQDLLFTVLNVTLVVPLVAALSISFSEVARATLPWIVLPRTAIPRWTSIVLIFVAMDACNWVAHLANHRIHALWRFHELHHSQEDMNVLTVFRTHPLIHVSYLIALLPAIVLLANGAMPTGLLVLYAAIVAFAHSNTNLGFGPLDRIFVSPNFHRIHHRLVGPQDVNLGFALTIWDQVFHRAVFPTEATIRADTGLPGRPLIVEQAGLRPRHFAVFAAQLVAPFRPNSDGTNQLPLRTETGQPGRTAHRRPSSAARHDGDAEPGATNNREVA